MNKAPLKLKDTPVLSKAYAAFRGVDFTTGSAEVDDSRSPDCVNMISDDAGFPEKRIGWRILKSYNGAINGLHYAHFDGQDPVIIVHHGSNLSAFDFNGNTSTGITGTVKNAPSVSFMHKGYMYLLDGEHFLRMHVVSGVITMEAVKNSAFEPTTGRGGHYEAEVTKDENDQDVTVYTWAPCEAYQEPNILAGGMANTFAGDGVNTVFWLTEKGCTVSSIEKRIGDTWSSIGITYTVSEDTDKTKITFDSAPAAAAEGAGFDNIKVHFTTTAYTANPELIEHCTIATQFGYFNNNRIFVSGNADHINRDWACAVDDPTYWELNQWTDIGSDHTAIMGYLHYGDALAIIKEDDNQDAEIYMRTATVQSENYVMFPVEQGVKGVGAISRGGFATLRDDALFYAREGVFAVSGTDASQMRTIQNRSYFVDNKLRQEYGKEKAVAVACGNMLYLAFPSSGHCYVADARMQTAFNESYVYEWFYWENVYASQFLEFDGNLFFGTADGDVCRFNNDLKSSVKYMDGMTRSPNYIGDLESRTWKGGTAIAAKWTTKTDSLGIMAKLKTITKRGCVCMLKPAPGSRVKIYMVTDTGVKTEVQNDVISGGFSFANIDFANFSFGGYLGTPQMVPFNSKAKKFQMIQIQFENDNPKEGFGIYGVQLQFVVNNYIK